MIDDLDRTIKQLLIRELPADLISQISISFAAPDKNFPPITVVLPAIDIFLYDIRENQELRTSERMYSQQTGNRHATLKRDSIPVSYSYIITAWSASTSVPDEDEHRLLGMVLQALLRYQTLPADVLQGKLAGLTPLPKAQTIQQSHMQSLGEFWSALGGRPKPVIHYTVTVPMYAHAPIENVPLITSARANTVNASDQIKGTVTDEVAIIGKAIANDTNKLLLGTSVTITNTQTQEVLNLIAVNGYFHAVNLMEGEYAIVASTSTYETQAPVVIQITKDITGHIVIQEVELVLFAA